VRAWSEERLTLFALGYARVLFFDLHCRERGIWRLGLADEQDFYLCPRCNNARKVAFLAEGFSRKPLPLQAEFIESPQLRGDLRRLLMMDGSEERATRKPRRAPMMTLKRGWKPNKLRPLWR
jgi:hypothetical protein